MSDPVRAEITNFICDFLTGQKLCFDGAECPDDANDDVKRGYSAQYQHEQNMGSSR